MLDGIEIKNSIADEALAGLRQTQKTLPAKLFYDEEGCRLFGEITRLPEYYPTRTETA
ncbi:MAG: L-histidine N(alpha)-methyltransferase, partial [Janthinobacterium lividum]